MRFFDDNKEYKKILGDIYKEETTNLETLNEIIVSGDFIFNLFDKKTLNLILEKPNLIHKINKIKDDLIIDLEKLNEKFENINIHINEELFFDKTYKLSNIVTIKKKIKNPYYTDIVNSICKIEKSYQEDADSDFHSTIAKMANISRTQAKTISLGMFMICILAP